MTWAHQPQYATDRLVTRHDKERKTTAASPWSQTCELSNPPIPCILGGLQSTLSSPIKNNDEKYDHARSIHQKSSFDYDLESDIDAIRKTEGVKLNWSDEDFGPAVDSQGIGTSSWGTWQDQKIDLATDRKKYLGPSVTCEIAALIPFSEPRMSEKTSLTSHQLLVWECRRSLKKASEVAFLAHQRI